MKKLKQEFSKDFELKNEIMATLLELGVMSVGESELELRIDWFQKNEYAEKMKHYQLVKDLRNKFEKE